MATLTVLVMAASTLVVGAAPTAVTLIAAAPQPCPAGFQCFEDGASFAAALDKGTSTRLALLCTAAKRCTISNAMLVVDFNVEVQMTYVDLKDHEGGLMSISGNAIRAGSVIGTELSFSGGSAATGGAVQINHGGNFTCTDCAFRNNSARTYGGGGAIKIRRGIANLIRPTFSDNTVDNTAAGPNAISGLCTCTGAGCLSSCFDPNTKEGAFYMKLRTAKDGDKLDLICTAESRCAISGLQLYVPMYRTVNLAYVDVMNHSAAQTTYRVGGLLYIDAGAHVTGTGLTFSGGSADGVGGAVFINYGSTFSCSDCTFRDNTATSNSGPISNVHKLVLKDPTFIGNSPSVETNCHADLLNAGGGGCTCTGAGCPSCCTSAAPLLV